MQTLFKALSIISFLFELSSPHVLILEEVKQCKKLCFIHAELVYCAQDTQCSDSRKIEKNSNRDAMARWFNSNNRNLKQNFEKNNGSHDFQDRNRIILELLKSFRKIPDRTEIRFFEANKKPVQNISILRKNSKKDTGENFRKIQFINFIVKFLNRLRGNSKRYNCRMEQDADECRRRKLLKYSIANILYGTHPLNEGVYTRKKRSSLFGGKNSLFDFNGKLSGKAGGEIGSTVTYGAEGFKGKLDGNIDYSGNIKGGGSLNLGDLNFDGIYEGEVTGGGKLNLTGKLDGSNGGLEGSWTHGAEGDIAGLLRADYLGIKVGSVAGIGKGNYTSVGNVNGQLDDEGQFHGVVQSDNRGDVAGTSIFGIGYGDVGIGGTIEGEGHAGLRGNVDINSVDGKWYGDGKHTYFAEGELEGNGGLGQLSEVEQRQQELLSGHLQQY